MRFIPIYILTFIFCITVLDSSATKKVDSLKNLIEKTENVNEKVNILNDLSWEILFETPDAGKNYATKALRIATKNGYKKGIADAQMLLGIIYDNKGDYIKALQNYMKALQIREDINDLKGVASALNNIGSVYNNKGNFTNALEYYNKALEVNIRIEDKHGVATAYNNLGTIYESKSNSEKALAYYIKAQKIYSAAGFISENSKTLNNIGNIYSDQGAYDKALEYYKKSLNLKEKLGDVKDVASTLNNIGILYCKEEMYQKAIQNYEKALKLKRDINDKKGIAELLNNIGSAYQQMKYNSKALEYFEKALKMYNDLGYKQGSSISLYNLGTIYSSLGKHNKALEYFSKSLEESFEIDFRSKIDDNYREMSNSYAALGNYKLAYNYHKKYMRIYNTQYNEEFKEKLIEMQTIYETEKKNKEILLLKKDQELKNSELKRSRLLLYIVFGGIVILLVIILLTFIAYRQKQKSNQLLQLHNAEISQHKEEIEAQRDEIENQRNQIEKKNKNITDSIKYAQRIQDAFLPANELVSVLLPKSFILFKPKDIVSGDFYWIDQKDGNIFIAAVDCTGHGVPGAFTSIVASNLLNQALNEHNLDHTKEILNYVNNALYATFRRSEDNTDVKVGMDMVICKINVQQNTLFFSGVKNSMYLIRDKELTDFKGDYFPIGTPFNDSFNSYHQTKIDLKEGDALYLFSDGYYDQFGGPVRRKFLSKNFKKLLIELQSVDIHNQKYELEKAFNDWKGNHEQIDDVLVIGIKI